MKYDNLFILIKFQVEIPNICMSKWLLMSKQSLVQNEELATTWLKILVTTGFSSDLLLNMSNFDWPNYKQLKVTTNLVTS